jgi:hypothetical protein
LSAQLRQLDETLGEFGELLGQLSEALRRYSPSNSTRITSQCKEPKRLTDTTPTRGESHVHHDQTHPSPDDCARSARTGKSQSFPRNPVPAASTSRRDQPGRLSNRIVGVPWNVVRVHSW